MEYLSFYEEGWFGGGRGGDASFLLHQAFLLDNPGVTFLSPTNNAHPFL